MEEKVEGGEASAAVFTSQGNVRLGRQRGSSGPRKWPHDGCDVCGDPTAAGRQE